MSASVLTLPTMSGDMRPWTRAMRARGLSERTVIDRVRVVARIASDVGTAPQLLTADQLSEWFASSTIGRGSRATYLSALRAYFAWLDLMDIRSDDPTRKLGKFKMPKYAPRPISTEQLCRLLGSGIYRRTRSMILLAAFQGFRASEIAVVRSEHIDREAGRIWVCGKGGKEATLPLHPIVEEVSLTYPDRGLWFPAVGLGPNVPMRGKSVSATISAAMRRAGIKGTPHALRHWYGTELRHSGADLRTVQELMRHANISTTALYTAVNEVEQREALARLALVA